MARLVSWPMYAIASADVARFWRRLRRALAETGLDEVPEQLTVPTDLVRHWRDPALLLSQTCGFPFVTRLAGAVRYLATPRFRAPGCEGSRYSSAIVVRDTERAQGIAGMAGRRVAFNSHDSQSGYNALQALVAPHARAGRFFGSTCETGSHRASLRAVVTGEADLAAIDAVTFALLKAHDRAETASLRILAFTEAAPGLPFVTSRLTSDEDVTRLRVALEVACQPDDPAAQALLLDGIDCLPETAYDAIMAMRNGAVRLGYPELA